MVITCSLFSVQYDGGQVLIKLSFKLQERHSGIDSFLRRVLKELCHLFSSSLLHLFIYLF